MRLKGPLSPLICPITDPPLFLDIASGIPSEPITLKCPLKSLCSDFWSHLILKVIIGRLPRQKPNSLIVSPTRLKTLEVRIQMRSKLQIAPRDRINQSSSKLRGSSFSHWQNQYRQTAKPETSALLCWPGVVTVSLRRRSTFIW